MDIITDINEQLNIVIINKDLPNEFSKDRLELRNEAINKIEKIIASLKNTLKNAEALHTKAVNINNNNNNKLSTWKLNIENVFNPPNMICEEVNGIQVLARKINYLEEVGPDLCFMPTINRFAIRIAGCLLIGNVGNVYDMCLDPERVRECKFSNMNFLTNGNDSKLRMPRCSKTEGECKFYHNPLIFPSSKEPRNFFATCGQYISPYTEVNNRSNYLNYGNRSTLKIDLNRLSQEEARRFDDFVAHLVLCWIILKRSGKIQ
jgi:hypothetical protein